MVYELRVYYYDSIIRKEVSSCDAFKTREGAESEAARMRKLFGGDFRRFEIRPHRYAKKRIATPWGHWSYAK